GAGQVATSYATYGGLPFPFVTLYLPPAREPTDQGTFFMSQVWTGAPDSVSVTIPVFNEEDNVQGLYERVCPALNRSGRVWEVVLVDDGSTDRSAALLDDLAARDPRVTVVPFRRNYGQTAA